MEGKATGHPTWTSMKQRKQETTVMTVGRTMTAQITTKLAQNPLNNRLPSSLNSRLLKKNNGQTSRKRQVRPQADQRAQKQVLLPVKQRQPMLQERLRWRYLTF